MYVIGEECKSNRNAFNALEEAFGLTEFSTVEATVVLQNALGLSESEVTRLVRELTKSGAIKEV